MPRKFFRRVVPSVDKVREVRALSLFGERIFHPALWHLNRRSAAGGVAVGLFCGLIPGPLQMLGAGIVCVILRVNLPVSLVTTLYTNPLTIVPLYLAAYEIGRFVLGATGARAVEAPPHFNWSAPFESARTIGEWMMGLGPPLALGVLLLACLLSMLGYLVVRGLWSVHLRRAWRARKNRPRGPAMLR